MAVCDPQGVKPFVMIMDGQESLWNSGLKALPEETYDVTEILDIIHVTSYIWEAANVFFWTQIRQGQSLCV